MPYCKIFKRRLGLKQYELKDHLGNIRALISDRKLSDYVNGQFSNFRPDLLSASNYYPFGMIMPKRNVVGSDYRYGFNGKEKDNDISDNGVAYDYGFRIYDSRIAKFLSVDPLTASYPWYTPYQFAGNKPIEAVDLDGLEEKLIIFNRYSDGSIQIGVLNEVTPYQHASLQRDLGLKFPNSGKVGLTIIHEKNGNMKSQLDYHDATYSVNPNYNKPKNTETLQPFTHRSPKPKWYQEGGWEGSSEMGRYYGEKGFQRLGEDLSESSTYVKAGGTAVAGIGVVTGQPEVVAAGAYIYKVGDSMDITASAIKAIDAVSNGDKGTAIIEAAGVGASSLVGRGAEKIKDPASKMVREVIGDNAVDAVKEQMKGKEKR